MNKSIVITGAILMVLAIILGAFGAHALENNLTADQLQSYETGVRYQVYHALALIVLGLNADRFSFKLTSISRLMLAGVILFSASIYLLSIQDLMGVSFKFLGPVTPLGGSVLIASWVILIIQLVRSKN